MYQLKNWKLICEEKDREIARLKEELERVKIVERAKREMTFDEEYKILKQEFNEIIEGEVKQSEPPFKNCVLRRAMRCIRKQCEELLAYKDLEEHGLLLKLPCRVGDTVAIVLMIPSTGKRYIEQVEVKEINIGKYHTRKDIQLKVEPIARRGTSYKYYVSEWGKNIHPTLAEAEKALEEMEEYTV